MEGSIFSITLADGTSVDNLQMNGNNYIYYGDLDTSIFTNDNLAPTIITNEAGDKEYHEHMTCVIPYYDEPGTTWFILLDRSEEEIYKEKYEAAIAVVAQATLDDETAEAAAILFPEWSGNSVSYSKDDRVRYNERLAKCLQDHISQPDWTPEAAPSLWVWISDPGVEWPDWVQPTGAHDAYEKGAKVSHIGKHWVSDVDGNVWEPGISNWTEQE